MFVETDGYGQHQPYMQGRLGDDDDEYDLNKKSYAQFSQISQNSKAMSCFQAVIAAASHHQLSD